MDGFEFPTPVGGGRPGAARRRLRYRVGAGASLTLAILVGLLGFAPAAFAHHSEISGSAACSGQVSWTAEAWASNEPARRTNNSVKVWYTVDNGPNAGATAVVGTGAFLPSNNFQFSGQFPWPSQGASSITLWVQEQVDWGPNQNLAGVSFPRSAQVLLPTDCPSTPSVSTSVACANGDGVATLTLSASGGTKPVTFVVTNPVTQATTTKVVAPGQSATVTVGGLPDGQVTIPVTADGKSYAQTVNVSCDRPGVPEVKTTVACADGDGVATVELKNTGGDKPVTFVVTNPVTQATTTKVVAPGQSATVTVGGLPDGQVTIKVTADGKSYDQTVDVSCDRPGTPEVSSKVACTDGDGTVVITLKNTGGDLPVTYTVTDPRTNAETVVTVDPGETKEVTLTGVADGTITIPVTAGGTSFDQTVKVACDRPGVPEVSSKVECSQGDGVIVLTLANKGGDLPVAFVVTDPRTDATTTRSVAPGATTTVTLTGFPDGPVTIPVTADGKSFDQSLTVTCNEPGVAKVEVKQECVDFDGTVVLTLSNTGGTEPVAFEVTNPVTNEVTKALVPVGGSQTVTIGGLADGTVTIPVTADGKPMNQTVTVDCDRPGTPSVVKDVECTEAGGRVTVTLTNTSPAGTAEPITFVVTDPRDGSKTTTQVVEAGSSATVVFADLPDGDYTIPVSADGEALAPIEVKVDCQQPAVLPSTVECAQGGFLVKVGNEGGTPSEVTVTKNGDKVTTVTVPANGTADVLVPMTEGEQATIEVLSGDEVIQTLTVTYDCQTPTTPTTPTTAPSTPTSEGAQVLAAQQSAPTGGTLPYTGSNSLLLTISACLLALGGLLLVRAGKQLG